MNKFDQREGNYYKQLCNGSKKIKKQITKYGLSSFKLSKQRKKLNNKPQNIWNFLTICGRIVHSSRGLGRPLEVREKYDCHYMEVNEENTVKQHCEETIQANSSNFFHHFLNQVPENGGNKDNLIAITRENNYESNENINKLTNSSCVLCWYNFTSHLLLPCNHFGVCERCSRFIITGERKCPICHSFVTDVVRVV